MAFKGLLAVLALLHVVQFAVGCSVPPGGCTEAACAALSKVPGLGSKALGFRYGVWNAGAGNKEEVNNKKGGPNVNLEVFTEVGDVVKYGESTTLSGCCTECAKTEGCVHYMFFENPTPSRGKKPVPGFYNYVQCYLLKGGRSKVDDPVHGTPYSGTRGEQQTRIKSFDASYLGGKCNGAGSVKDDPHFTGALGTKFDFNGELDKSFCLTADKNLQVNVLLRGYEDDMSTVGATPLAADSNKALRSWIKEVGLLWVDAAGSRHEVQMIARNGKQQERGDGFMARMIVDGVKSDIPSAPTETIKGPGGFAIRFVGMEKHGALDVEQFAVSIDGLAEISMRMRVAHPALQTPEDAEAHFNIEFEKLTTTPAIHGVLGQTYRNTEDQVKKALQFGELATLLHGPVKADGETGKGFLDGEVADYETSNVLSADCRFSSLVLPL